MKMKKYYCGLLLTGVFAVLAIAVESGSGAESSPAASLWDEQFITNKFRACLSATEKHLTDRLGRPPTQEELADSITEKKVYSLVDWVYSLTLCKAAEEFHLQVSEEDQRKELSKIYGNDDQVLEKMVTVVERLPKAWREAKRHPDQEKYIYETQLKDVMSHDRWQCYLKEEGETIRRIEQMARPKKADLYQVDDSFRQILVRRAIKERVVQDVKVSEEKLLAEYERAGYNMPFEEIRASLIETILKAKKEAAWQEWITKRMINAPVVISDPELSVRYKRYLKNLSAGDVQIATP